MTSDPFHPGDHNFRICSECDYPYQSDRADGCPNPACRPGMKAENERRMARARQRDAWVEYRRAQAAGLGTFYQPGALESAWEREHPESPDL